MKLLLPLTFFICLCSSFSFAEEPRVLDLSTCNHGLYPQPEGSFSAFVFCDDGAGVNVGVILTAPGPTPTEKQLEFINRTMEKWGPVERFWQDGEWAADVTALFWSPSQLYLYLSTSDVYGDGGVFRLDLMHKKYERVAPMDKVVHTQLVKFDPVRKELVVEVEGLDGKTSSINIPVD